MNWVSPVLDARLARHGTLGSLLGVPLDNNAAERILKKAILSRKNSYFYKTARSAHVGDMYMSLISTQTLSIRTTEGPPGFKTGPRRPKTGYASLPQGHPQSATVQEIQRQE
jgi:hypothetical protein